MLESKNHDNATTTATVSASNDGSLTLWQAVRKWPRIIAYCIALSSASLLVGYDYAIVGQLSAIPRFQRDFGQRFEGRYIIPSTWLALWSVASPIGAMMGAAICGPSQDRFGRKPALIASYIASAMAVGICFVADIPLDPDNRRGVFLTGKLGQGMALGLLVCAMQTYMSEILPPRLRGPLLAFFPIFLLVGQITGAAVVFTSMKERGRDAYKIPIASQWPFSALPLFLTLFIPESPTWLVRGERICAAMSAQCKLDPSAMDNRIHIERLRLDIAAEKEHSQGSSYQDCFKTTNLRRTLIICFVHMIPKFLGLPLLFQGSYFLQILGMRPSTSVVMQMAGMSLGLLANVASIWTLHSFDRRHLSMITFAVCTLIWLGFGIAGCSHGPIALWYISASMLLVITIGGIGSWPACYVIAAETSSLRLRANSQAIGWISSNVTSAVFSIFVPYLYNSDAANLKGKVGFLFAGTGAFATVLLYFFVPEMKNRSAHDVDVMFQNRVSTRQFKRYKVPEDHRRTRLDSEATMVV